MSQETESQLSIYERLGGAPAINAAVEIFYDKVLRDEQLLPFFVGIDMKKQISKMKAFMSYAFGGLPSYQGKPLRESHKKIVEEQGLNETHFNLVAEHLVDTLNELEVPEEMTAEVMAIVGSTKNDILNL